MEKVLDLKMPGVQELGREELREVDGGIFGIDDFLVGVAIAAVVAIVNDWDNFERGLTGRPYKKK